MSERVTYVLVDGENIDATLGNSILQRRPLPAERPRWERLLNHLRDAWGQPTKGLFFLAANHELPMGFVQALVAIGYKPVPLSGGPDEKIVDIAIQRTLTALKERSDDVVLVSHDRDFVPQLEPLLEEDDRRVGIVGFREFLATSLRDLLDGVQFFDLESDVGAFNERLPRLRVIPIDEFDPADFL